MKILKNIIYIIIFIVCLCYCWYLFLQVGYEIFVPKNKDYITSGLGAFFGAFWIFAFMEIFDFYKKIKKRKKRHVNALVMFTFKLNKYLAISNDNLESLLELIDITEKDGVYQNYKYIAFEEINDELLMDLVNIDFINDVFGLNVKIYKSNELFKKIVYDYENTELGTSTYMLNGEFLKTIKQSSEFLKNLDEKIEILMSKTKTLLLKDISFFDRLVLKLFKNKYYNSFENDWKKNLIELKKQRKEMGRKSLNEINELINQSEKTL